MGENKCRRKLNNKRIVDKPLRRRKTRYWRLIKSWQIMLKISAHLVTWSTMMPNCEQLKFRKQMAVSILLHATRAKYAEKKRQNDDYGDEYDTIRGRKRAS